MIPPVEFFLHFSKLASIAYFHLLFVQTIWHLPFTIITTSIFNSFLFTHEASIQSSSLISSWGKCSSHLCSRDAQCPSKIKNKQSPLKLEAKKDFLFSYIPLRKAKLEKISVFDAQLWNNHCKCFSQWVERASKKEITRLWPKSFLIWIIYLSCYATIL